MVVEAVLEAVVAIQEIQTLQIVSTIMGGHLKLVYQEESKEVEVEEEAMVHQEEMEANHLRAEQEKEAVEEGVELVEEMEVWVEWIRAHIKRQDILEKDMEQVEEGRVLKIVMETVRVEAEEEGDMVPKLIQTIPEEYLVV